VPVSLSITLAAQVDVESNRLAAKPAVAKRLYRLPLGSVSDFLEGRKVAFARLLNSASGQYLRQGLPLFRVKFLQQPPVGLRN